MTENQTPDAKRAAFEKSLADLTADYEAMYAELDLRDMDEVTRMSNHELRALRVILEPRLRLVETQLVHVNEKLARLVELAELSLGVAPTDDTTDNDEQED